VALDVTPSVRSASPVAAAARMAIHQIGYDMRSLLRNGQRRFFTFGLPIIFLFIFATIFGNRTVAVSGGRIREATYYIPAMAAFGIVVSSFANNVIAITSQRESGILKRRRATPVPAWVLIAGRTATDVCGALVITALLIMIGAIAYGAHVPTITLPAIALSALVGAVTFSAVGYAISTTVANVDAALPVVQAVGIPSTAFPGCSSPRR
jgi:ABC-2 type transport system permease protein